MKGIVIYVLFYFFLNGNVLSQDRTYPKVGNKIPSFSLNVNKENTGKLMSETTLKGKHFILDFWSTGCLTCIASFPKMDSIQLNHPNDLKVILVGLEEKNRKIDDFYEIYRKRFRLKLSSVFDSSTFNRFVPATVPHLIWVDKDGIVKAITSSRDVNEENIRAFISNKPFKFYDAGFKSKDEMPLMLDKNKPLLIAGNGGNETSYLFRSLISLWDEQTGVQSFPDIAPAIRAGNGLYQVIGAPVQVLYVLSFLGSLQQFPDLYIDPQFSNRAVKKLQSRFSSNQRYNYSIEVPQEMKKPEIIMNKMQNDLSCFFGLNAELVKSDMPCYNLIVTDEEKFSKIVSDSGKTKVLWKVENEIQSFTNVPIDNMLRWIKSKVLFPKRIYAFNETRTRVNVSFDMKVDVNDIESIRKGLQNIGLDLMPSTRPMRVIRIDVRKVDNKPSINDK